MDKSIVICFSSSRMVQRFLLQRETRPTWAYPAHYTPALASSVISRLSPLSGLAVRVATNGVARRYSVSMFCIRYGMDLGPLCYTGSLMGSRRATLDRPDPTACRFGPSLEQPRMARPRMTMLTSIHLL